ncbi:DNA methyltransferase [Halostreptopolyspora alba]|uniref:site-specific DNA-methyltransferase (adenine-specific) n=1 Tax=Halostreptopolyspora alba TaxID=2487137 RepID=A0A3N0E908_9ACTN|nr:DNA methyltransferase [Nocardiopsaceae bacterium YIM 96095]
MSSFGAECAEKLQEGAGQPEAALRGPVEGFLTAVGSALGLTVVAHEEARQHSGARPDFAIRVQGAITGHVELKKPGQNLDPARFTGHNKRQWERLKDLPNLLYTNGTHWRLYRHGELVASTSLAGDLHSSGSALAPQDLGTEVLLREFLRWSPPPVTTAHRLVEAVAPLCRLLRESVLEQLAVEHKAVAAGADPEDQPFSVLAHSWRNLLFPSATDAVFADGYAQTVTFALLLARTEGIDVAELPVAQTAHRLEQHSPHALMSQALKLLSESAVDSFQVTIDLLRRVIGAVDWQAIWADRDDAYLHLYESFLGVYDPELRKESGSYYTPAEVVQTMVRLTDEVLTTRLEAGEGYLSPSVTTIDPAMGTGTYLHAIIDHAARRAAETDGPGAVSAAISDLIQRLIGFELQMGPYTVAEMRAVDLLKSHEAPLPKDGMRLHVTDTLDDPYEDTVALPGLTALSKSHKQANKIKSTTPVTVVIGNPPYRERAEGMGGWVESGSATDTTPPLDRFRKQGNGRLEYVLKNLYVYFWSWATWKVFEAHAHDRHGVICFITTSGYLKGPGFKGMRRYLRRTCSEGWIINVSPEGMRPEVPTRVFPGVQQPLAIALFVRRTDTEPTVPAEIHYTEVTGRREDKYTQLATLSLDSPTWRRVRTDWEAPFLPGATSGWDDYPALGELFCWVTPGIKPNRTWVYGPHPDILRSRWTALVSAEENDKPTLFKETSDRDLSTEKEPLPQTPARDTPMGKERGACPEPKRVAYRSFDRQWIIPDHRVIDRARTDLWAAERAKGQLYLTEQHSQPINSGPAVAFSALIPDMHHFNVRGGRVLPLLHPNGTPNLAHGLLAPLISEFGEPVTSGDLAAYIAGVTAHPAFTTHFADELTTPGVRVPLTADVALWREAANLGRELIWATTYGDAFADPEAGRPTGDITFATTDPRRPKNLTPIGDELPEKLTYHEGENGEGTLHLGHGSFGPVTPRMWNYDVGGMNIIKTWFASRKANPGGKKTSPLDDIHLESWPREWITEFNEVLTALRRVTELEPAQADLLERVLAGPLITREQLTAAGVRFPNSNKDRKPHYDLDTAAPTAPSNQQTAF